LGSEWNTVTLESVVEPDRGISYGIVQPGAAIHDGVPIVRVTDIRNGRISGIRPLRVSPSIEAAYSRTRLRGGELLLTLVGTVGEAAVVPQSLAGWNTARAVAVIPVRSEIGAHWVRLALQTPAARQIIESRLNTTVQVTLNLRDVAQLPIVLPPKGERDAIARIISTLDDKIELNRRMSETLEAIARALFKSWFVDFDPVRAKAEGREPSISKPVADLFPGRLVDTEVDEIPEGWAPGTLAKLSMLNPEAWTKQTRPREIRYVDLSNTKWGHIESVALYEQTNAPSRAQRVLRPGDTAVGMVRPGNGSYAFISEEGLTGSTGFAVLRPRNAAFAECVYLAATAPENIEALTHLADGAAYPAVRGEVIAETPVIRAPDVVIEQFSKMAKPLFTRAAATDRESRTLVALRDALPKFISGELRVTDAQKEVDATA
jgi:type I restriction enzyme, S subunit